MFECRFMTVANEFDPEREEEEESGKSLLESAGEKQENVRSNQAFHE